LWMVGSGPKFGLPTGPPAGQPCVSPLLNGSSPLTLAVRAKQRIPD
jgi:hypothetical protein